MSEAGCKQSTLLVTGAYGAIGLAIARRLAADPQHRVVLAGRDSQRLQRAAEEIRRHTGNPSICCETVDLGSQREIEALAERWDGALQVLINNAATAPRRRMETAEGIEVQFATNVLGYFRMMQAFRDILAASAPARIINVASYWAGGLDLDDLEFTRRAYDNDRAYRQSKQADRMLSVAFARRLEDEGISVNACHPGDVHSNLSHDLGFGGHQSPEQAAETPCWLATDAIGKTSSGRYFEHGRETACHFSADDNAVERLFAACAAYDR